MPTVRVRKPHDIGAVIRAARDGAGLTQTELASQLAISRDYLVGLESSREPNLYISRLLRTLHELGVTVTLSYAVDDA